MTKKFKYPDKLKRQRKGNVTKTGKKYHKSKLRSIRIPECKHEQTTKEHIYYNEKLNPRRDTTTEKRIL